MKNKIKTFLTIIKWVLVGTLRWLVRAMPKTKKDISYFLNLLTLNYFIYTLFFMPAVLALEILPKIKVEQVIKEVQIETIIEKEIQNETAWVANRISEANLNPIEAVVIISKESGYRDNNEKFGVNTNGSIDLASWQINSIHYGNKWKHWQTGNEEVLTLKCVVDYKCATDWAISKRLRDGNWAAWYGARKAGIN